MALIRPTPIPSTLDASVLGTLDYIKMRAQIDAILQDVNLQNLDMSQELVFQYLQTKDLLETVRNDEEIDVNKRAQLINSLTSIIEKIAKMQIDLYNSDRLKKLEGAVVHALDATSPELKQKFLDIYKKSLGEI